MRRPKKLHHVGLVAGVVVLALAAGGGCSGGCSSVLQPLPQPLPASQTIEGGVQVRVTRSGLKVITQAAKQIISNLVAGGICVPRPADVDLSVFGKLQICNRRDCSGGAVGCKINLSIGNVGTSVVNASTLRADLTFSGSATVPITYVPPIFSNVTCNLGATLSNAHLVVDVRVATNPTTGELEVHLAKVDALNINPDLNICDLGLPSDIVTFIVDTILDLLGTDIGLLVVNLVTPYIDDFIQSLLPKPLGIEGRLDLGALLAGVLPGIDAKIEVKGVPGGYASLPAEGVSVGVIVGINADRDPSTRTPATSSEPALCVPQWPAPDLGMPPASLGKAPGRQTFSLKPAGAFLGVPDPSTDVAIGLSQTLLDLAGHHVVASGALCLGVGSSMIPQLNLGTVGILVRSLSELGHGKEPILLILRPTAPITFDVGSGSATSPYITAHIKDLEVDFYALLFERYVRAFTIGVTVDAGINLEFMIDAQHKPVIVPTLVGLDASKIQVKVSNAQLLRETPEQLEKVFPTLVNLFLPVLTSGLPNFPVPAIEGFTLGDLRLGKVTTSEDDFLAVYASLARAQAKPVEVPRAATWARVTRVSVPAPERILAALDGEAGGALPEVELDLGGDSPTGEPLEWQWRLNRGMWRPFDADPRPILRDPAFAVQGQHTIEVRARVAGRYETTDLETAVLPVVIDSAPPRIFTAEARRDGDEVVLPVVDAVAGAGEIELALGAAGASEPATAWAATEGRLAAADLETMAGSDGEVTVFARDPSGNRARAALVLDGVLAFHGQRPPAASGCQVAGAPRAGGAAGALAGVLGALLPLLLVVLGRDARPRRPRSLLPLVVLLALAPGCSSSKLGSLECLKNSDCASKCPAGQVGVCDSSGICKCLEDIPLGWIGEYSDVAVAPGGAAWVSAYNSEHGDLMVASHAGAGRVADSEWQFVDGVPAGPVVNPATTVRGGIRDPGDDVGLYTSIAMAGAEPVVSYYDLTHGSLRFASHAGGKWTTMAVEDGVKDSKDIGKYTAISVDATGRPGIAYLAILKDAKNTRSEIRFAQAKTTTPASPGDWTVIVVESKAAPPDPSGGQLDDLPYVDGLFIAAARTAAGDPVVAWYDRVDGDLKLAEWNRGGTGFKTPVVVDGGIAAGADVGWYPSIAVSADGKIHVSYVDATGDNLLAVVYPGGDPEVIDDGYRTDGTTAGGLPRPVYHLVGDNSGYVAGDKGQAVVYQDATAHELRLAVRGSTTWTLSRIAGSETPYKGSYGFYAAAAMTSSGEIVMSSFVINQTTRDRWVEIFRKSM